MSRPQEPQRPFLQFGNPFKIISPKSSNLSPNLLSLLNDFEKTLEKRLKKLKPTEKEEVFHVSWMRSAMASLCGIHSDIKSLITALDLPVCDWDDKWIDVYLSNSVKLLDICIAFSSEICRLRQLYLYLQCVLHHLTSTSPNQFVQAQSSLDKWSQERASKNPRLGNCFTIMNDLVQTLDLPKIKNSAKGKVLMRAMYGVKVITLLVCSIFAAALSGSVKKLIDLQVPKTYLWAEAFTDIQIFVNSEIKSVYSCGRLTTLKELETVETHAKKLYPFVQNRSDHTEGGDLGKSTDDLRKSAERFSLGLDLLAKEIDSFFHIILTGRDALLCNLRIGNKVAGQLIASDNVKNQVV